MGTIFESLEECHGPSPKNPIETTILDGVVGRKISESGIQSVHTTTRTLVTALVALHISQRFMAHDLPSSGSVLVNYIPTVGKIIDNQTRIQVL